MTKDGYIKLYRHIMDSKIWHKPNDWFKIWQYILLEASWTDPVGSLVTSYADIAKNCSVSKDSVKNFLEWARLEKMIETEQFTRGLRVKVVKFEMYQTIQYNKSATLPSTHDSTHDSTLAQTASISSKQDSATLDTTHAPTHDTTPPLSYNKKDKNIRNDTNTVVFLLEAKKLGFSEEFEKILSLFITHRQEIKKKLTPTSFAMILKKFASHGEKSSIDSMLTSIEKGWQGLFFNGPSYGKNRTGGVSTEGSYSEEV